MVKRLVRHEQFGEGRVVALNNGTLTISFFELTGDEAEQVFARTAIEQGFLTLVLLEKGRRCQGPLGTCQVIRALQDGESGRYAYEVSYESGATAVCSETELDPVPATSLPTPSSRLAVREIEHLLQFRIREAFRNTCAHNLRQGGKLAALLAARVDLHPHQAFVAGTVLDDRRRRYILADEVGLGKTIEAGVVIHDLLTGNPGARVLVICPGTLTQQWFCEIYSKFGGQIFTLLDLHSESSIRWDTIRHVIVSMGQVLQFAAEPLLRAPWDLVVIDECHHLLTAPVLYEFAASVSRRCRSLLLLSAIPAQQREDEYFKLLALLEPDKFDASSPQAVAAFRDLFESQAPLSRRLQPLIIRLHGIKSGDYTPEDVVRQARRLLELPILASDRQLAKLYDKLVAAGPEPAAIGQQIVDYMADRYRVYRRILRNRRAPLQRDAKIDAVTRRRDLRPYPPGDLERNAIDAVESLLAAAWRERKDPDLLITLARTVWQSMASSDCALELLRGLAQTPPGRLNQKGRDFLSLGPLLGYEEWQDYIALLQTAATSILDRYLLDTAINALTLWNESKEQEARYRQLTTVLRQWWLRDRSAKLLVFAGHPNLAEEVAVALATQIGEASVASFRADMSREQKEEAASRFRRDPATRILVSDETGGEGRNFEFADAVVHYDTPWQISRVEQRIGRLDRIGRTRFRSDVTSVVICPSGTVEEALIRCYDEGLNVYQESVSGLEFSLRQQESQLVSAALAVGVEGLVAAIPGLGEVARNERARDEYDALLDWASFDEDRAQRFLSVRSRPEVERALEATFVEYYQSVAKSKAARPYADERSPAGLWEFQLDAVRPGILPADASGTVCGTFRRDVAQLRVDRAFFQIGNPFFDAISRAAQRHPAFRTYAVQCRAAGRAPWAGFEFVFSCEPNLEHLGGRTDLTNLVLSFFPSAPIHIFIDVDGQESDASALHSLRQSLTPQNKGKAWVNLWKEREVGLDALLPRSIWTTTVLELSTKATELATERFRQRLSPVEEIKTRWSASARKFREQATPVSLGEAATLEALIAAITDWRVSEEAAGFLAVNHNLVRYA
ncbi:MAG: SNF2-related protein [Bryobacteraceae bacterium]